MSNVRRPQVQVWYRVIVRIELAPRTAPFTILARGRDGDLEHWFDGGNRYTLFLQLPSHSKGFAHVDIKQDECAVLPALIQCWDDQPAVQVGTKWITNVNHKGSIAFGRVVDLLEVWDDRVAKEFPTTDEWKGYVHV